MAPSTFSCEWIHVRELHLPAHLRELRFLVRRARAGGGEGAAGRDAAGRAGRARREDGSCERRGGHRSRGAYP